MKTTKIKNLKVKRWFTRSGLYRYGLVALYGESIEKIKGKEKLYRCI
jgi:hypothetical protein